MKKRLLFINLYIGLVVQFFSSLLLILQVPFMKTWFFPLAWWSFILVVDSLNFRKMKSSPLSKSINNFLFTAFISVFVWLIFELFNLRLKNWTYHNLPTSLIERWLGYFVAFASVIPAMKEIALFIESFLYKKELYLFEIRVRTAFLRICVFFGGLSVFLVLAWPHTFFPLTWLCFIFLLEPLNLWLKNETFIKKLEKKEWATFWSWIISGCVMGFLWEFWNFWAGSHWEYFIPYLNFWRVFQMPIFGYTGFLAFSIEIFVLYQFLFAIYKKLLGKIPIKGLIFIFLLLYYTAVFYLIDTFTLFR